MELYSVILFIHLHSTLYFEIKQGYNKLSDTEPIHSYIPAVENMPNTGCHKWKNDELRPSSTSQNSTHIYDKGDQAKHVAMGTGLWGSFPNFFLCPPKKANTILTAIIFIYDMQKQLPPICP